MLPQPNDEDFDLDALFSVYTAQFGVTFSRFNAIDLPDLPQKMIAAIESNKPITDKDLGITVPEGAES